MKLLLKACMASALIAMIFLALPAFAQEANETEAAAAEAPAPKNQINVSGETLVSTEGSITVVPQIIDEELHNRALILRSIGTPLYKTGEVLVGISAATWVLWVLTAIAVPAVESFLPSSDIAASLGGLSAAMLPTSIALSSVGTAFLIAGGVTRSLGDDYRDRSFSTPE